MSDDLVKRLRDEVILERFEGGHVSQMRNQDGPEAADRIEKLEAALRDLSEGWECCPVSQAMRRVARKALDAE
jgi:hypothetical protein